MHSPKQTSIVYYLLVFLYWFAIALPLALLILLLQARGLDLFQISLVFGIHSLTVVLLEVPTGSLADIVGRKHVTIWAAVLMLIGFSIFLIAFSFPLMLLGGIVYGASRALASGSLDAWAVDTVLALDADFPLQALFAKSGVATLGGLAFGTLCGSIISLWHPYLPLEGNAMLTPYALPLVASLVVQAIRLLLIVVLVREDRPVVARKWQEALTTMPEFIGDSLQMTRQSKLLRWLLLTGFTGSFVMVSLENFWQPHFANLMPWDGHNSVAFGVIMAGNFVLGAIGNMLSGLLAQRLGNRLGLLAGGIELLRGVALLLLVGQSNLYLGAMWFWLLYFGMGMAGPAVGVMMHGEISAEKRSTMLSIQSMISYLGIAIGSVVLGAIADATSIGTAWAVGGCVLIALLLPYVKIDRLYQAKMKAKDTNEQETPQLQTV